MSINFSSESILAQLNSTGAYSFSSVNVRRTINETKVSAKEHCNLFTKSIRNLKKTDISTDSGKTSAKKHLNNLLTNYNSLSREAKSLTSKTLDRRLEKLDKLFDEYADDLKTLGIEKNSKGKMTFDKTKIDELTDNKAFDSLFGINSDFSTKLERYTKGIKSNVSENVIELTNVTQQTTVSIEKNKIFMANSANTMSLYINSIAKASDKDSALTYMTEIINSFNNIFDKEKETQSNSEYLDMLSKLVEDNSDALNEIGVEAEENGTVLSFTAETDATEKGETTFTDNYEKALSLFNDTFGNELKKVSEDLFCHLLETSKHDIIIDAKA